jgi:putative peptide zinc metalloprotease protein
MIGVPVAKSLWFLLHSPSLAQNRTRALALSGAAFAALALALFLVPLPYRTVAEGIVWSPGEPGVFAGTEGSVVALLREPNSMVQRGAPLVRLEDPLIDAKVKVLEATVKELRLRRDAVYATDPLQTALLEEQVSRAEGELALNRQRQALLTVRSPEDGRFILRRPSDLMRKFVRKGEQLGQVAAFDNPILLAVVPEDAADLVRTPGREMQLRLVGNLSGIHPASIVREVPTLTDRLPSMALSTIGGGEVVMDPRDTKNPKALTKNLHLEIRPATPVPVTEVGGRAYVRFDHGSEPLAWRLYREVRQLFLRRFNV